MKDCWRNKGGFIMAMELIKDYHQKYKFYKIISVYDDMINDSHPKYNTLPFITLGHIKGNTRVEDIIIYLNGDISVCNPFGIVTQSNCSNTGDFYNNFTILMNLVKIAKKNRKTDGFSKYVEMIEIFLDDMYNIKHSPKISLSEPISMIDTDGRYLVDCVIMKYKEQPNISSSIPLKNTDTISIGHRCGDGRYESDFIIFRKGELIVRNRNIQARMVKLLMDITRMIYLSDHNYIYTNDDDTLTYVVNVLTYDAYYFNKTRAIKSEIVQKKNDTCKVVYIE